MLYSIYMARFLGVALIVLMILLAPPSVLALISNSAVPGDKTYPIKRALEAGILVVASVNPSLKAAFTVERSNRRFLEAKTLIDLGKNENVTESLGELVSQTKDAAKEVTKVPASSNKKKLVSKLKDQVKSYDKELEKAQKKIISQASYETPPPQIILPSPTQSISAQQKVYQSPPSITTTGEVTIQPVSPAPSPTIIKSITPTPTIVEDLSTSQTPKPADLIQTIEKTREELKEINQGLQEVDTNTDSELPFETPVADELPSPQTSADTPPEPSPVIDEEPSQAPEPTLEPSPGEPPAFRMIRERTTNTNDVPESSDIP